VCNFCKKKVCNMWIIIMVRVASLWKKL